MKQIVMKKILLFIILVSFSFNSFAAHYVQKGNVDKAKSTYLVYKGSVFTMPKADLKPTYDFYGDVKQAENDLVKTNQSEYLSASGKTHDLIELFKTYEARAFSMGEHSYSFNSNHDTDVFVMFSKTAKDFTINIYTGQDAIKAMLAASSEK